MKEKKKRAANARCCNCTSLLKIRSRQTHKEATHGSTLVITVNKGRSSRVSLKAPL